MTNTISRRYILTGATVVTDVFLTSLDRRHAYAWHQGPKDNVIRDLTA